jgi:hypothetical protein
MEFKITTKYQHGVKSKNGRRINYRLYFLNDILIYRQRVPFDETIKQGWITRKKNIITSLAQYENIVYMHDYIRLEEDWYKGQLESGNNFKIRMNNFIEFFYS